MGFVERAFTPPGSSPPPLGSPANPIPPTAQAAPPLPQAPAAPTAPPTFGPSPTQQAQAQSRARIAAPTILGAAAAAGQTQKVKLG